MTNSELRADIHSIEPIPDADRDSPGRSRCGSGRAPTIAPVNWALGALGIILKLGLWETIAVIVIGNAAGSAIFAAFTVMGHKTGVNQMVLARCGLRTPRRLSAEPVDVPDDARLDRREHLFPGQNLDGHPRPVSASRIAGSRSRGDHHRDGHAGGDRHLWFLCDPHLREIHRAGHGGDHGADERAGLEPARCRQLESHTSLPPGLHLAMLSLLMTAVGAAGAFPG